MTLFTLNWAFFYVLLTSKEGNIAFPPPCPLCNVVPLFELPTETHTPTLNGGDRGGVWILLFSEVTLFEYNVSTILLPIVALTKFGRSLLLIYNKCVY